jgi:predicted O-methyltransferase YrrM
VSRATLGLDERLLGYLRSISLREPDVAERLREETAEREDAEMQIAPEQGQLMALLVRLIGARRTLEIGTFTGYSALVTALALPEDGVVVACDVNEETGEIARRWWAEAEVADRIDLRIGPAVRTLDALLAAGEAGRYDFAFIDADKTEYPAYWERCLRLVRSGGLIAVDNVLRRGRVVDPSVVEPLTVATRAFNRAVHADERVDLAIVPIADGLTLARVR